MRAAVGLITAPREPATLSQTLDHLPAAGWRHEVPYVSAEPDTPCPDDLPAPLQWWTLEQPAGPWGNWLRLLHWLRVEQPEADYYLLLQDDVQLARAARRQLEYLLWHRGPWQLISLYTPANAHRADVLGWHDHATPISARYGAVAIVLTRQLATALYRDPPAPLAGTAGIDHRLARWAHRHQLPYRVHSPSLAWHLGTSSTLRPGAEATGNRQCAEFGG